MFLHIHYNEDNYVHRYKMNQSYYRKLFLLIRIDSSVEKSKSVISYLQIGENGFDP